MSKPHIIFDKNKKSIQIKNLLINKINNNQFKGVMKEAFKRILPDEILNRGKRGFSIPSGNFKDLRANKISKQEKILNDFGFYVQ